MQFVLRDKCLAKGPDHPFTTAESRRFQVLEGSVRVLGVGGDITVQREDCPTP